MSVATNRSAIRHSHSRSRNLLSLPLYPPSIVVSHRRPKPFGKLLCPLGSAFRSAFALLFCAFTFFTLDVLHATSVQSAWNVVVPISGTIPQPAATLVSDTSIAALHHAHNLSRQYRTPQSDPLAVHTLHNASSQPSDTSPSVESHQKHQNDPSTIAQVQQSQSAPDAAPDEAPEQRNHTQVQQNQTEAPEPQQPQPAEAQPPQEQQQKETKHEQSKTPPIHDKQQQQQPSFHLTVENAAREALLASQTTRDAADFSNFDQTTALNYFHLHKTGGVSFKERIWDFFSREDKIAANGKAVNILDTCHNSGPARPALGTEAEWSCDWGRMEQLSEQQRNEIDLIVGHQYWEKGAEYWVPKRDLRYFTVMRHPLHRKISFFHHFFVRNAGKKEESIALEELIPFLLGKHMPDSPLVRDAGPNYYASRLCSDGFSGYSAYTFVVAEEKAGETVFNSIRRLRQKFVFIGLQTQEKASLCMLRKSVAAFSKARGIQNMSGLDVFDQSRERMNTGSYPLTAKIVWERMSEEQRREFKQVEKVDLAIYKESVKMFHEMVRKLECRHLVEENDEDSIGM